MSTRTGRYRATIKAEGRRRCLGRYDTPEEASAAYLAAKRELHPFWGGEHAADAMNVVKVVA
jgi:hypothetical protein